MCGICGVIQIEGELRTVVPPEVLDSMTDSMIHRGPNDRGTYQEPGVALGVRRLSIVDVEGGHQPFLSEDGAVVAIQNGELYNHEEVRAELTRNGHHLRSRCDTEILPHLYEDVGERLPERVRGKFGLAVWDGRRRRALIARDRLGVKPLYYARSAISSSLPPSSRVCSRPGSSTEHSTTTRSTPTSPSDSSRGRRRRWPASPSSRQATVSSLATGTFASRSTGAIRVPAPRTGMSADEHAEGLLAELEEAVRLRLMSDVPLGAMLSGGLDSSLIVALMARHTSGPVKTFSVGFVEDDLNELADAREVAQRFGADHHELELSRADTDLDLPRARVVPRRAARRPLIDRLPRAVRARVTTRHRCPLGPGRRRTPGRVPQASGGVRRRHGRTGARLPLASGHRGGSPRAGPHSPSRRARYRRRTASSGCIAMSGRMDEDLRRSLFRGPLEASDGSAARNVVADRLGNLADAPLPATLYIDAKLALVDDMLHYFDRASMAHSLEVRVPFLDHSVVEYCAGIPAELKVRRLTTKYLLKRASRGILPDRIIDKRKIGFFAASVDGWFRDQAGGAIAEYLLAPQPHYAELLDPQVVRNLVRRHAEAPDQADARLLLAILMLEVWLSTFLPRALGQTSRPRIAVAS